jgi:hypothetical protein
MVKNERNRGLNTVSGKGYLNLEFVDGVNVIHDLEKISISI